MSEHDDNLLVHLAHANNPTLIKVIGVGGGGGNAVAHMYRENLEGVRYLVCNTDRKALDDNPVPDHLQLGPGLGAGGKPEKGRELAEENIEKIKESLDADTRMVFITFFSSDGSVESPHFVSTSSWNFDMNSCTSFISSIISVSPSLAAQKEMERSTFFELKISLLLSNGEWSAASMALLTRFSPSP